MLTGPGQAVGMRKAGDELPFDWAALVPRVMHPMRVSIIEAMLWVERPISATDFNLMADEPEPSVSRLSYHFKILADPKVEVIEQVREEQVRGAIERFYYFPDVCPVQ